MKLNLTIITALFLILFLLVECTTSKEITKDVLYDYPEDVVADTAKKSFVKQFNKGKILYRLNCAKCHSTTVNGKEVIPDFSLPQLMDYEIRIQYPAHEDDLKDTHITHDELDKVVTFLRYKKRNPISANTQ